MKLITRAAYACQLVCQKLTRDKLHVIPCGVDVKQFRPAEGIPLRLLAVGRFVEKKAPHLTIKAFAQVLTRFPEAQLDMIGGGALLEMCRALIREIRCNEP